MAKDTGNVTAEDIYYDENSKDYYGFTPEGDEEHFQVELQKNENGHFVPVKVIGKVNDIESNFTGVIEQEDGNHHFYIDGERKDLESYRALKPSSAQTISAEQAIKNIAEKVSKARAQNITAEAEEDNIPVYLQDDYYPQPEALDKTTPSETPPQKYYDQFGEDATLEQHNGFKQLGMLGKNDFFDENGQKQTKSDATPDLKGDDQVVPTQPTVRTPDNSIIQEKKDDALAKLRKGFAKKDTVGEGAAVRPSQLRGLTQPKVTPEKTANITDTIRGASASADIVDTAPANSKFYVNGNDTLYSGSTTYAVKDALAEIETENQDTIEGELDSIMGLEHEDELDTIMGANSPDADAEDKNSNKIEIPKFLQDHKNLKEMREMIEGTTSSDLHTPSIVKQAFQDYVDHHDQQKNLVNNYILDARKESETAVASQLPGTSKEVVDAAEKQYFEDKNIPGSPIMPPLPEGHPNRVDPVINNDEPKTGLAKLFGISAAIIGGIAGFAAHQAGIGDNFLMSCTALTPLDMAHGARPLAGFLAGFATNFTGNKLFNSEYKDASFGSKMLKATGAGVIGMVAAVGASELYSQFTSGCIGLPTWLTSIVSPAESAPALTVPEVATPPVEALPPVEAPPVAVPTPFENATESIAQNKALLTESLNGLLNGVGADDDQHVTNIIGVLGTDYLGTDQVNAAMDKMNADPTFVDSAVMVDTVNTLHASLEAGVPSAEAFKTAFGMIADGITVDLNGTATIEDTFVPEAIENAAKAKVPGLNS